MGHGGPRPGSGRKPTRAVFKSPVREAEAKIADKLPWLVDRLMDLAGGVQVEETTLTGATFVYQRPPDRQACEYLIDRIMGKAVQPVELRERAERVAALLGVDVQEVIAEAEKIATGRR